MGVANKHQKSTKKPRHSYKKKKKKKKKRVVENDHVKVIEKQGQNTSHTTNNTSPCFGWRWKPKHVTGAADFVFGFRTIICCGLRSLRIALINPRRPLCPPHFTVQIPQNAFSHAEESSFAYLERSAEEISTTSPLARPTAMCVISSKTSR